MKCIYCNSDTELTSSDIITYAVTGVKLTKSFVCRTHNVVLQIKGASNLQIIFYEKKSRINFPLHYWNTVMHII